MSWENFTLEEFACKHCGKNEISHDLIDKLQELREECEFPFIVTSGYRCSEHPAEINKDKPGMHAKGLAVDILLNKTREEIPTKYATKEELKDDVSQILDRFDRLEEKLDKFLVK